MCHLRQISSANTLELKHVKIQTFLLQMNVNLTNRFSGMKRWISFSFEVYIKPLFFNTMYKVCARQTARLPQDSADIISNIKLNAYILKNKGYIRHTQAKNLIFGGLVYLVRTVNKEHTLLKFLLQSSWTLSKINWMCWLHTHTSIK